MDLDKVFVKPSQPPLLDFDDSSNGMVELFPRVWQLLEAAISPDVNMRRFAMKELVEMEAVRLLPLIAYFIATRITDPDVDTRALVVYAISDALLPDDQGKPPDETVRQNLLLYLSQMRTRQIYAIIQVLPKYPNLELDVARLLNACPYAGNQMSDILASRKASLEIRRCAIRMIGLVGYLDAVPALERLLARLESRLHGQTTMSFAQVDMVEDAELIPDIRRSLAFLQSP
jgi:HEAT repeat protein